MNIGQGTRFIAFGIGLGIASTSGAQTMEVSPSVYRVESGVTFDIANESFSNYLFTWSDSSGTVSGEADPTLILTAGETYTFRRTTGSHPFAITDDTLPVSGTDGSYNRTTFDAAVVSAATLDPAGDFTADPAPTSDVIEWTLTGAEIGEYFYTCLVLGHPGMTGRIEVVAGAVADNRDVQIRSVDFVNSVVELYNFGEVDIDLTGWRSCTHDFNEVRRYSAGSGLNGVVIEAGTSVYFHYENDAPMDEDRLNIADIGGAFALPLDQDAYGMQIFFPDEGGAVSFGNSSLIADHVQWNIDGQGAGDAEFRTGQSVSQGLWTAIGDFIATSADSESFSLTDNGDGRLHGPSNYTVVDPACAADLTGEGDLNFLDVSAFLSAFGSQDPVADFTGEGQFNFLDVSAFLSAFGLGCP